MFWSFGADWKLERRTAQASKTKSHWGLWAMKLESDRFMEILRKEGNLESIKHRDIWWIKKGRAVESEPPGIRTFIRTPMFTWTQRTKQLKTNIVHTNASCSHQKTSAAYERFVKGAASTAPGKPEQNLRWFFCWCLCQHRSHGCVATMHTRAANKVLAPGKTPCLAAVFLLRSTYRKFG